MIVEDVPREQARAVVEKSPRAPAWHALEPTPVGKALKRPECTRKVVARELERRGRPVGPLSTPPVATASAAVVTAVIVIVALGQTLAQVGAATVVELAVLLVRQNFVGRTDFYELLLCCFAVVRVLVGMILQRQAPVGALDILLRGILGQFKRLVCRAGAEEASESYGHRRGISRRGRKAAASVMSAAAH